ncbi:MAG: hypothetical protein ACRDRL_22125 [Sciscionella sp.]
MVVRPSGDVTRERSRKRSARKQGAPRAASTLDELLVQIGCGNRDAFGEFYDRTATRVYGTVRTTVCDAARSEAVTAAVYRNLWRAAPRFLPGKGRTMSWLLSLACRVSALEHASADAGSVSSGPPR